MKQKGSDEEEVEEEDEAETAQEEVEEVRVEDDSATEKRVTKGDSISKKGNTTPKEEQKKLLIKFEIELRNKGDAIKMAKIIGRAANLKKESIHGVAKFLFEQCLAEYRANGMLD